MSLPVLVLDKITLVAPFGVRFWDVAVCAPAAAGLNVIAYRNAAPELRFTAFANHIGIYYLLHLPGLQQVERGYGDDAFWSANPPRFPFTVEVSDPNEQYLPLKFSVLLPSRGLLHGLAASPLLAVPVPDPTWVPVFSTPSRVLPGPAAVIHAELKDDDSKMPAAWALVEARFHGMPAVFGVADARGMITIVAPYPEPVTTPFDSPLGSPLGSGSTKLSDQSWLFKITVYYTPQGPAQKVPSLEEILHQRPAQVWRDTGHSTPASGFIVTYGKDLVLRSLDSGSGRPLPVLLITPAASPL